MPNTIYQDHGWHYEVPRHHNSSHLIHLLLQESRKKKEDRRQKSAVFFENASIFGMYRRKGKGAAIIINRYRITFTNSAGNNIAT